MVSIIIASTIRTVTGRNAAETARSLCNQHISDKQTDSRASHVMEELLLLVSECNDFY
jgi:hypothetical protein